MDLNRLLRLRRLIVAVKRAYWVRVYGMDLDPTVQFSLSAYLDRTFPKGIHVGAHTWIALKSMVLSHDRVRGLYVHTRIGQNCFVGAGSIIMPGVQIGDGVVVAAGAVVVRDVPDGCIVAGNPAKVVRENVKVGRYGRFKEADEVELGLRASSDWVGRTWG